MAAEAVSRNPPGARRTLSRGDARGYRPGGRRVQTQEREALAGPEELFHTIEDDFGVANRPPPTLQLVEEIVVDSLVRLDRVS